jgi:hypothetical protein
MAFAQKSSSVLCGCIERVRRSRLRSHRGIEH